MKIRQITTRAFLSLLMVSSIFMLGFGGGNASAASCVDSMYRYGSRGTCVKYIQALNNFHAGFGAGYYISTDGIFGSRTNASIRDFQSYWRLRVDGIVGPQSWRILCYPHVGDSDNPGWVPSTFPIWASQGAGCAGAWQMHY